MPLLVAIVGAGCAGEVHHVDSVAVGTEFTYEDPEGGHLVLTYNGTFQQSGLRWHHFESDSWIPPVYPNLRFVEVETGGKPWITSNHLPWANESKPQFGWDLRPGRHEILRDDNQRYTFLIEVKGDARHTSLLVENDVADYGWKRMELHRFVFEDGDLLPRSIESSIGWNGQDWDIAGTLIRMAP